MQAGILRTTFVLWIITNRLLVSFKANISQNTGVDWKNVDLKLATAKTNVSAQIPYLNANYLQFYYPSYILNKVYKEKYRECQLSNSAVPSAVPEVKIRGYASVNGENDAALCC